MMIGTSTAAVVWYSKAVSGPVDSLVINVPNASVCHILKCTKCTLFCMAYNLVVNVFTSFSHFDNLGCHSHVSINRITVLKFTRSLLFIRLRTMTLYIYISLSLSFTPGLKPTSFTNPTPVVSLLPPGLPPRIFAWTVSSELLCF